MMKETHPYTAGEMRSPVEIQRPAYVPDGSGGQDTTWATWIPVVWCAVEEVRGEETFADKSAGRVRSERRTLFTTWYRDDIRETDRILYLGHLYNVRRVNNLLGRNKFLQITAETGVEQ